MKQPFQEYQAVCPKCLKGGFEKQEGFHIRGAYKCPHCKSTFSQPKQVRVLNYASSRTIQTTQKRRKGEGPSPLISREKGELGTSPIGNIFHHVLYPAKPRKKGRW
jgi:predicted nucleic-acid-binding Zn-ribbon protein